MFRYCIRSHFGWALCLALSLLSSVGETNLFAANEITSLSVNEGSISVELAGAPAIETNTFTQGEERFFVVSFHDAVLLGKPVQLQVPGYGSPKVEITQFTLRPDVVHVVVHSFETMSVPVETLREGSDRYRVSLAFRPPLHLKVFLDVGHGGYDPGGTGPDGLPESFVNLAVAKHLAQLLRSEGVEVRLDRSDNSYVSLPRRVSLANESGTDLFLGLYCNASRDRSIQGTTTYYYHHNSYDFARYLQNHVATGLGLSNDGVREDNLYVLRHTTASIPDVLIEYAYISNHREEQLLSQPDFRDRIATALANAVTDYFAPKAANPLQPESSNSSGTRVGDTVTTSAPDEGGQKASSAGNQSTRIVGVVSTNGTLRIESVGKPEIGSFALKDGDTDYFVVNLQGSILSGSERSLRLGPPFSGEVTVAQFSLNPNVVRIAVREDYQNSYGIDSHSLSGDRFVTTIYPTAN